MENSMKYKRVLLKLSGESLGGPEGKGISEEWLARYAGEIAEAVHGGLQVAASQKDRARAFDRYVRSALWNPLIIGVHYFKYTDQAATGRPADDENIQCGFVDIADTPYWEMVGAARKVSQEMYQYRIQHGPRR